MLSKDITGFIYNSFDRQILVFLCIYFDRDFYIFIIIIIVIIIISIIILLLSFGMKPLPFKKVHFSVVIALMREISSILISWWLIRE